MVTAQEVTTQLKIPRQALYRLVRQRRIPFEDVTQPWHARKQYRFCVEAVRAALTPPPPA
jgi:hypothetical protein